jgi:ATP:corrinoid adenosyltransferase
MAEEASKAPDQVKNRDEVALEMMKFIAVTTGYGKGTGTAGFTGKATKTPEEYAEALLQLFERCRDVVGKGS